MILINIGYAQSIKELTAKKNQVLSQMDQLTLNRNLQIDGKDEFETFKEYLQRIFKGVFNNYETINTSYKNLYHGSLRDIEAQLDELINVEKESDNIIVTLDRYIAEKSIYLMKVQSAEKTNERPTRSIEAEIDREDAKQLKRNWSNVEKMGYMRLTNSGSYFLSHFKLTNPETGYVYTHFFDVSLNVNDQGIRDDPEVIQILKVPFYALNSGEVVVHENESMLYMESDGTFYLQIKRGKDHFNIIDGIEYGPYRGASCPTFNDDGWHFYARKEHDDGLADYKINYDFLGATEIPYKNYEWWKARTSKNESVSEDSLYEINKGSFTVKRDKYNSRKYDRSILFPEGVLQRTGSLSTDVNYNEWAIGVYKYYNAYNQATGGPYLKTSYGTFEPDSWNIGHITINNKEFYCYGTLEGNIITLNFPIRYNSE